MPDNDSVSSNRMVIVRNRRIYRLSSVLPNVGSCGAAAAQPGHRHVSGFRGL